MIGAWFAQALPPRLACCAGSPSPVSACPASLPAGARETEGASLLTTQGGVSHPYGVAVSAATGLVYVSSQARAGNALSNRFVAAPSIAQQLTLTFVISRFLEVSTRATDPAQETGRVTEHAAYPSGAVLRTLAAFGNAAVSDDAGVRGIAVRG